MNIFVFILEGPGEAYVESKGTFKVSWRPHHTGYICTRKNNGLISLTYMWKH